MIRTLLCFSTLFLSGVSIWAVPTNVVFCIADDASPHFGAYGCNWAKTPNIDKVAASGMIFDNAYTPTAKCAPSRASILTGRNPWLLEEAGNHQAYFPHKYKAFSESLRENGVMVGSYGKVWGPGEAKHADGSTRDFALTAEKAASPGAAFEQFLGKRQKDQPFFFWFGSKNPHRPYKLDAGLEAGKKPTDIDRVPKFWPDNDVIRRDMLDYSTEIEAYDSEVGEVIKVLEASGEASRTLVIITSDHGMPFPRVKGHNYDMANHVPFIVRWPGVIKSEGEHVAEFTSLADLAPTFLDVFGISHDKAGLQPITGSSLMQVFTNKATETRKMVLLGRERTDVYARAGTPTGLGYPIRGIREGNFYYLHNFKSERWPCGDPDLGLKDTDDSPTKQWAIQAGQGTTFWEFNYGKRPQEELFDLSSDPDCVVNLAQNTEHQERVTQMREKLFKLLREQQDPRVLGNGDVFDNYPSTKRPPGQEAPKSKRKKSVK
ncbi:MAG: sulfatase [Verrucomicrobiaceae bacterium]|nr:sulfatase [Verrucomicrobiaceae bacterium]